MTSTGANLKCSRCGVLGSTICRKSGQHQIIDVEVAGAMLVDQCAICGFRPEDEEEEEEEDWGGQDYRDLMRKQQAAIEAGADARRDDEARRRAEMNAADTWQAKDQYNQAIACWAAER